ncbi:uncharacterized protein DUF4282 [Thermodesulfitimonas autotrophica]|uniref:Uncharacterized protein DUF4282 n=1 Tax=Thermodesulfitimonas autotrophica TaxID=1894989 RepID=A0A3N5ANH1_9THEO|nr:DUF4282 domain-containing protein [Thermodesulfitimonas autotrophica]RPF46629.1 uncharacterized protein DUF4282 [Thermodesulfitimonas autotrophica]
MTEKSFWSRLFDFSFSSFVTLKIIPVLYGLWIAIGVIVALGMLTGGVGIMRFGYGWSGSSFFLSLIWAVVFFFLWVIGGRVWMETIIVLFRIAENTSALVRASRGGQPESSEGVKDTLL